MPRGEQSASLSLGSCMKKGAWRCQSDQGSEGRIPRLTINLRRIIET